MTDKAPSQPFVIYTIGHSTRTLEEFIHLLQTHGVVLVADVRSVPRSRHNPQFDRDTLPDALQAAGIAYCHFPGLGGLRHAHPDSPNKAWHNASFRGYADYMQTTDFELALEQLLEAAAQGQTALMCAEAVPWRCHRSLIADALTVRGIPVEHITGEAHRQLHALTSWAHVDGLRITYPPERDHVVESQNS